MNQYRQITLILLLLHLFTMVFYLHSIPGLLGDEGSEGENVYLILDTKQFTIYGERSYIGPLIDYIRIPFIAALGYSVLPLRILIVLFSVLTFLLAASVGKKIFGETASLYIVAAIFFSPIYILYQRLGWAITIIPFFTLLILWLLQRQSPWKYLWAGLAAGIGLHNHFIFLPTLAAIITTFLAYLFLKLWVTFPTSLKLRGARPAEKPLRPSEAHSVGESAGVQEQTGPVILKSLQNVLTSLIGFLAGFGTQLAVLLTMREDQGDPGQVVELFSERFRQLGEALPAFVSGSVFSAFYTGEVFAPAVTLGITVALVALTLIPLFFSSQKPAVFWWVLGIIIQLLVLVVIVDRFAARYFVMTALSVWGLAGLGLYVVLEKMHLRSPVLSTLPVFIAILLTATLTAPAFLNFIEHGGSTNDVVISSVRREPAAAFVDVRPLFDCLASRGPVHAENIHIYNRLLYISHSRPEIEVTQHRDQAKITVDYRTSATKPNDNELCPQLTHFQVLEMAR